MFQKISLFCTQINWRSPLVMLLTTLFAIHLKCNDHTFEVVSYPSNYVDGYELFLSKEGDNQSIRINYGLKSVATIPIIDIAGHLSFQITPNNYANIQSNSFTIQNPKLNCEIPTIKINSYGNNFAFICSERKMKRAVGFDQSTYFDQIIEYKVGKFDDTRPFGQFYEDQTRIGFAMGDKPSVITNSKQDYYILSHLMSQSETQTSVKSCHIYIVPDRSTQTATLQASTRIIPNVQLFAKYKKFQISEQLNQFGNIISVFNLRTIEIYAFIGAYVGNQGIVENAIYIVAQLGEYYMIRLEDWIKYAFTLDSINGLVLSGSRNPKGDPFPLFSTKHKTESHDNGNQKTRLRFYSDQLRIDFQ
eukprot:NODE_186_length_13589_cov_0.385545.p3 type:complete len:361 gc:universal NODE_186_length_13589_cov_0.385545:2549-3631(+)